jgi:hypothetical protein
MSQRAGIGAEVIDDVPDVPPVVSQKTLEIFVPGSFIYLS